MVTLMAAQKKLNHQQLFSLQTGSSVACLRQLQLTLVVNMVAAVHAQGEGLNTWGELFSKEYRRAIIFCALVTLAPLAYGYDGTYFTALLETPVFGETTLIFHLPAGADLPVRQFGDRTADGYEISSSDQSLWVSIIQVGEVVGSLAAGPIGCVSQTVRAASMTNFDK